MESVAGYQKKENLARPISEYLNSNKMVTIYVGPERKAWHIDEDLLCDRLPFFEAVFQTGFISLHTKVLELPEVDLSAFAKLVDWVHTLQISCTDCEQDLEHEMALPSHQVQWCALWVLADKIGSEPLMNHAEARLGLCLRNGLASWDYPLCPEMVAFLSEHIPESGKIAGVLIEFALYCIFSDSERTNGLGKATSSSDWFNEQLFNKVKEHMEVNVDDCEITRCKFHDFER